MLDILSFRTGRGLISMKASKMTTQSTTICTVARTNMRLERPDEKEVDVNLHEKYSHRGEDERMVESRATSLSFQQNIESTDCKYREDTCEEMR